MDMQDAEPAAGRLERLGQYLDSDPDNAALLKDYAAEAWRRRELEACQLALRQLDRLGQLDVAHTGFLARVCVMLGDTAQASALLQQALRTWPDATLLRFELARTCFAEGDVEQALARLPQVGSDVDAELAAAITALRVRLLHHAGQLEAARQAALDAEGTWGGQAGLDAALLPVLVDLGRLGDAVERARRTLAASPAAVPYEVCEPFAMAALDAQQPDEAQSWIDKGLGLRRDDGRMWLLAAMFRLQRGDRESAAEAAEQAAELMPGHAGSHLARGWIALLQQNLAEAGAAFERGIEASRSFSEAHGSLAVVKVMQGDVAAADLLIRKAQQLDKACASAALAQALRRGAGADQIHQLAQAVLARARTPMRQRSDPSPTL